MKGSPNALSSSKFNEEFQFKAGPMVGGVLDCPSECARVIDPNVRPSRHSISGLADLYRDPSERPERGLSRGRPTSYMSGIANGVNILNHNAEDIMTSSLDLFQPHGQRGSRISASYGRLRSPSTETWTAPAGPVVPPMFRLRDPLSPRFGTTRKVVSYSQRVNNHILGHVLSMTRGDKER